MSFVELWCHRYDMTKFLDKDFKRRTIESLKRSATTKESKELKKGQINIPLLHIPLENVVPDELHLMLRITDVLIRNLISGAMNHDAKHNGHIRDVLRRPMVLNLLKAIRNCGVSFNIYINKKEAGGFDFTSLVGNERKKLLCQLPSKMSECQPQDYCEVIKQIWEVAINNYWLTSYVYLIAFARILQHFTQ